MSRSVTSPCSAASAAPGRPVPLAELRARVARLEGAGRARHGRRDAVPVCDGLDLPGGGLARAALHEVLAAAPGCGAAFCALLLARAGPGAVLWIAAGDGGGDDLVAWPPGFARFGLDPARLVLARTARWPDALWAMEEALRCPAVAGAALVPGRGTAAPGGAAALDLTATRRLQLAAEAGGALGLLLRPDLAGAAGPRGRPGHGAAATRWRVAPLPARETEQDLGEPRWQLELLRARGGAPGGPWAVTWRDTEGRLALDGAEGAPSAAVGDRGRHARR